MTLDKKKEITRSTDAENPSYLNFGNVIPAK